jgi:hypothetical protein
VNAPYVADTIAPERCPGLANGGAGQHLFLSKLGEGKKSLIAKAKEVPAATTIVVHPCDESSLRCPIQAAEAGIIVPILVGPAAKISAVTCEFSLDIDRFTIVDVPHREAAAAKAVELIHESKGERWRAVLRFFRLPVSTPHFIEATVRSRTIMRFHGTGVLLYLLTQKGMSPSAVENLLSRESGLNAARKSLISMPKSPVALYIVPTDEELMIARHTLALLRQRSAGSSPGKKPAGNLLGDCG